jgi:hypothetical protein
VVELGKFCVSLYRELGNAKHIIVDCSEIASWKSNLRSKKC